MSTDEAAVSVRTLQQLGVGRSQQTADVDSAAAGREDGMLAADGPEAGDACRRRRRRRLLSSWTFLGHLLLLGTAPPHARHGRRWRRTAQIRMLVHHNHIGVSNVSPLCPVRLGGRLVRAIDSRMYKQKAKRKESEVLVLQEDPRRSSQSTQVETT